MQNYRFVKRFIDIIVASTGLLVLSPVLLITAVIIRIDSRGPVLYTSKRVGQYWKVFDLIKFRTMVVDSEHSIKSMDDLNIYNNINENKKEDDEVCFFCKTSGRNCSPILIGDGGEVCENTYILKKGKKSAFYKFSKDPRVTRTGKFLRRMSIDELPQLINILRGDMSLIGNRPLPIYEAEALTSDFAIDRFNVPAGLTGLWQVRERGKDVISEQGRINLDNDYAQNFSLKMDIFIFLKTFPALYTKINV
jgi:lipopolysaccharide/colanic/teichoic acid biosynthesis glycosyltransferase